MKSLYLINQVFVAAILSLVSLAVLADGAKVTSINFSRNYPPLDAVAVNGVAGTGLNEIALLGENPAGQRRLQIKDLLSGNQVIKIPIP